MKKKYIENEYAGYCNDKLAYTDETPKQSHTPTPWKLDTTVNASMKKIGLLETIQGDSIGRVDSLDDATFIVKSVNMHFELKDSLESIIALIEDGSMPTENELKEFKEVIAKAEGE